MDDDLEIIDGDRAKVISAACKDCGAVLERKGRNPPRRCEGCRLRAERLRNRTREATPERRAYNRRRVRKIEPIAPDAPMICNCCGEAKAAEKFASSKSQKSGRKPRCSACEYAARKDDPAYLACRTASHRSLTEKRRAARIAASAAVALPSTIPVSKGESPKRGAINQLNLFDPQRESLN